LIAIDTMEIVIMPSDSIPILKRTRINNNLIHIISSTTRFAGFRILAWGGRGEEANIAQRKLGMCVVRSASS